MGLYDVAATEDSPRKRGTLSRIGAIGTAALAPWLAAYGNNSGIEAMKLQAQQDQADLEFQKYLAEKRFRSEEMGIKRYEIGIKKDMLSQGKPIYMMGPDGQPIYAGTVPKGSQVVTNPNAPTADMKNAAVTASQARILWDEVKSQSEGLKGGYAGMGELAKAALNRGKGESGNYSLYTENLPSSAVSLYRALTGDTRLSDSDAKARALPLLWEPSQDESLRDKKNSFIDKMIGAREQLLKTGKYTDGVIPMNDLKKYAKSLEGTQSFSIGGVDYNIPLDKVEAFKKAKGLK